MPVFPSLARFEAALFGVHRAKGPAVCLASPTAWVYKPMYR